MSQHKQSVVYGAGGHGRVVADAATAAGFEVKGFLDDFVEVGRTILEWRVLGDLGWLQGKPDVGVALGIGTNDIRQRVHAALAAQGITPTTVIHPSAVLSPHARLGIGSVVLALAAVNSGAFVGTCAIVNTGAIVEHDVYVGDFAHVASNAALAGGAKIDRLAMLGTGASVLPGKEIGQGAIVGAGAVVSRHIPPNSVASGVPARIIRTVEGS